MAEKNKKECAAFGTHLFNDGWEFAKLPANAVLEEVKENVIFVPVGLPHDWLIGQVSNLYENSSGWYRKWIHIPVNKAKYVLRFEGIYMDSVIYINRREVAQWKYGYSTFEVDITRYLSEGRNEILVQVNHQAPNSRWYSGAGIYRNVWLKVLHSVYLVSDGSYVTIRKKDVNNWKISVCTEIENEMQKQEDFSEHEKNYEYVVEYRLLDRRDGSFFPFLEGNESVQIPVTANRESETISFETIVSHPALWDMEHPNCYELQIRLLYKGNLWQEEHYTVGFRTVTFSPSQGFLLNGRKVKLNGVCEHHDLGCLGAAYHSQAMRRKIELLKKMGVNALRLSHNMPAPDVMELADEMGVLVVSEAFDMWERSKTKYDYARFFPEWYQRDIASWIRRDRNHPSLIMWSIGNEIYDTHVDDSGQKWTKRLIKEVRKHDPSDHASITIGSNYMPWENAQKCADIIKVAGYNYSEKYYDAHHEEHPDWIIYGSETSSTVQSRGVYHFPYEQSVLADEDRQCSALGNSTTSWGAKSSEACIIAEREHEFSCGQFLWTGFDYIGEPTPYHTKNSYFGQLDTAGFPKDSYYIYQAEWTDGKKTPMVHLFPFWDFNDGQIVDVRICSNASRVELFLNGESQGDYRIDHQHGNQLTGNWKIPFQKGELKALAYDEFGNVVAESIRRSFGEASTLVLRTDQKRLNGNGQDLAFLEISAEDEEGYPVENASNRVRVEVTGAGRLIGLDNGDSTDEEEYQTDSRRLFNGKLLAVIAAGSVPGEIRIRVSGQHLKAAELSLTVIPCDVIEGSSSLAYAKNSLFGSDEREKEIPVRAIRLTSERGTSLDESNRKTKVTAAICPKEADDTEVIWCAVNDAGIPSSIAQVSSDGLEAEVTALSDGIFRLRCMSKAGTAHIRVISELDFKISGLGKAWKNPYTFICGGLYDYSRGTVSNGNEHGIATARDGETQVGFSGIDFGDFGSDEITLPIFALTDETYPIQIWEGMPGEDRSQIVGEIVYQKPSIWNTYQEETYHLERRLNGITSICFVVHQKIHLKGFQFTKLEKAYQRLMAGECDKMYGDSFSRNKMNIEHIGNNVTIQYGQMDFGEEGTDAITICGYTPMEKNAIQIRFISKEGEHVQMIEFLHGEEEQKFPLTREYGCCEVRFVFLPGSEFDFYSIRFHKAEKQS